MGSLPFLSFCGLTGLPLLLLQIVPELLIREEVVDVLHKQMAVQMLDLMAEGSGRQALYLINISEPTRNLYITYTLIF